MADDDVLRNFFKELLLYLLRDMLFTEDSSQVMFDGVLGCLGHVLQV